MNNKVIKSVGIDIGTSTTKLMMSDLTLGRVSSQFALPHFDIIERKVTYVSEIISTPLINEEEIDLTQLVAWLEKEYLQAGLTISDIQSGAVIITGETAIKKNADALIHYLSERAGDFVVAIAGASLEAVLAGRGSGSYEHSMKSKGIVANIDIGGGTANVVLFQQGKILETITFHVGGRLIEINPSGKVLSISPSIRPWLFSKNLQLEKGRLLSLTDLTKISTALAVDMLDCLAGKRSIHSLDLLVHSSSCEALPRIDEVMISGGVGQLTLAGPPSSIEEAAKYNDFGPLLATSINQKLIDYHFQVIKPLQTSRATVIGAGMQTTKISGATISIQANRLPLRNIPVIKISLSVEEIERNLLIGKEMFGSNERLPFAIGLSGSVYLTYEKMKDLSLVIGTLYHKYFPRSEILVIVCENDMAKALGQALQLQFAFDVICIDQINIGHGDYIDIGEPLTETIVPVVVKTLAFRGESNENKNNFA
ncbi:ethanolamine ammonia-lyase reactivating factor EutA [Paenibacillus sp. BSR1-1]|uniref:ethanolamine ammonia-lyase reactivating factor EutA n=1 Tax=Paenibacillus sp. BSR1-1 TaxID=3020845 RepID=UPI0025B15098|nr:ethanolamine ammonia-lyase reactivating factor EutA [Paenibacillus sp. BSR1-1]MDN3016474.1 ethanolamine ammonia-lyase reactivating factor EutA [Paenibacillus sp. BSR1-1]